MCGICGIISYNSNFKEENRNTFVQNMNAAILHRGPDKAGDYQDKNCALAMRRLSIIDLSTGHQPIFNETENIGVFFNGEIYNYADLKKDLLEKGHQFRTHSDTEVLVHLYEEYGEKMLPLLRGMFAFCIFNKEKKEYFLARDSFGEKPLYYHFDKETLSFSSEIKSLLENKNIPRQLNYAALPYYFRTSLLPEPMTLFKDVFCLSAGHFIKVNKAGIKVEKYFQIEYNIDENIKTDADAEAFIKPILDQAVRRQTVSDVPIGAFLSGGIDSSSIVALLQKNTAKPIQTFTARFEEEDYDESSIARKVAEHCGTEHHELVIPNYDFSEDIFWTIINHVGQPFRDSSAIPSYFLTKEIGQHVKVALSGDGGDELFGGYDLFQWYLKIIKLRKAPHFVRKTGDFALQAATYLPGLNDNAKIRQIKRGVSTSLLDESDIPIALNAFFSDAEINRLLQKEDTDFLTLLKDYPKAIQANSDLRKIMYYRNKHTLPGNMLVKIDRMAMANSLEVRAPFLDPDLYAAAAQLPDKFLIRNGKGKHIIREIMRKELPAEVFNHPKSGFSIPLHKYQNTTFKALANRLLFEENPFPNLFSAQYLRQIYEEGINGAAGQSIFQTSHKLWMLMQLLGWGKRFEVKFNL